MYIHFNILFKRHMKTYTNLYNTYKNLCKTYTNQYKAYKNIYKTYNNLYKNLLMLLFPGGL